MDDKTKKQPMGSFADMMEVSEQTQARKEETTKVPKKESSLEQKNVSSKERKVERTEKHHSFDVFIDQLISLDQIRTQDYQESGKKPKISTLVQEALDAYIVKRKK